MKKWQSIFTMVGGILLPIAAFAMGLLIGNDDGILCVMPTAVHAVLVASVPARL